MQAPHCAIWWAGTLCFTVLSCVFFFSCHTCSAFGPYASSGCDCTWSILHIYCHIGSPLSCGMQAPRISLYFLVCFFLMHYCGELGPCVPSGCECTWNTHHTCCNRFLGNWHSGLGPHASTGLTCTTMLSSGPLPHLLLPILRSSRVRHWGCPLGIPRSLGNAITRSLGACLLDASANRYLMRPNDNSQKPGHLF